MTDRNCYAALARLDELASWRQRRTVCQYISTAAAVLCLEAGTLWTPLLDAVVDAYTRLGGSPSTLVKSAVRDVVAAIESALRRREDNRLALRLLRRWRSPLVHHSVLHCGIRHVTPALRREVLALPTTSLAMLPQMWYAESAEWLALLEPARQELLRRLEVIDPATAEAQVLVGTIAELTVSCADAGQPVSHALGATPWMTMPRVTKTGAKAASFASGPQHDPITVDELRQLALAVPVPESARRRRSLWGERTLRAIHRVVQCSTSAINPPASPFHGSASGVETWLELALCAPITRADAPRLLQVARPYARWRQDIYDDKSAPPVLALLAHEGIPGAVVVRTAYTLSDAEWDAAVPAIVRRAAVRAEPALRQRLAQCESGFVQAILALDEPVATLGERLRQLLARDPGYALAAIDARREDAWQVLRRHDLLPLLRSEVGSVRQGAAALMHRLTA